MTRICISSYYGLRESLYLAAEELKNLGHEIFNFSLLEEKTKPDYVIKYINYIQTNKIDIVLWWHININIEDLHKIILDTKPETKHIFYNWDDPYSWSFPETAKKVKYFDCAFTCCKNSLKNYLEYGVKEAYFVCAGFSRSVNHILEDGNIGNKYACDISIACTNLYENKVTYPNQIINRKKLIDTLYANQTKYGYTFHIYGPDKFKNMYPDSYKGYISYEALNLLFNRSKINICTHVVGNQSCYLNERACLIAGSGGLLLVDNVKDLDQIFDREFECVVLDQNKYLEQILSILNNYDKYIERRINIYEKSNCYSWKKWAELIDDTFIKKLTKL